PIPWINSGHYSHSGRRRSRINLEPHDGKSALTGHQWHGNRVSGSIARAVAARLITRRDYLITISFFAERQVAMKISQRTTPTQATAALAVGLIAMAVSHPAAS